MKKSSTAPDTSSRVHSYVVQPVVLNRSSSPIDSLSPVSATVHSFEDAENMLPNISRRYLGKVSNGTPMWSRKGLRTKRRGQKATLEPENRKREPASGTYGTDTQQNEVEQPSSCQETMVHDEETLILMQENKKLMLQVLELERREDDLNLKVQKLRSELGDVQREYTRLLAESKSMDMTKDEKNGDE